MDHIALPLMVNIIWCVLSLGMLCVTYISVLYCGLLIKKLKHLLFFTNGRKNPVL